MGCPACWRATSLTAQVGESPLQAFHGVLIAPSHPRSFEKELETVNGLRTTAPEDVHRSQMALASSRQAKLPTLPVVQQNDPIGYYVANMYMLFLLLAGCHPSLD